MGVRASLGSAGGAVPGQVARLELAVENTGDRAEDLRVALAGHAAEWGWVTPPTLRLAPGATAVVAVMVRPPRAPHPPPGPREVAVEIIPAREPGGAVTAVGTVEVAPFAQVAASLRPHTSTGGAAGRHRLTVENQGNVALAARCDGEGEDVSVRVEPAVLHVPPGEEAAAEVVVRTGRRPFGAGTATRPFEVRVRAEGAGTAAVEGVAVFPAGGVVRRVGAAMLVLALGGIAVGTIRRDRAGSDDGAAATTESPPVAAVGPSSDCPGRDHVSPDANGVVRPGVRTPFDYSFLFVSQDGCQPARFNPCEPVRYVLNRAQATDADVADLEQAMRRVSEATGLEFQFAGTSTLDPRNVSPPVRAADGAYAWPPVIIGWAHLGTGEQLRAPTTGTTAPSPAGVVGGGGRPLVAGDVITTGNLVLNLDAVTDTDTNDPVPHGFGPGVNWGRIMLHELAHVIGLGHVESRTSIMNETLTQQTISSAQWGVGDLIGLRYLGKDSGCLSVPTVVVRGTPPS